ncbi:MAG: peptidoglycan DD-metalloendopeptidase family protein [Bacteroidales bacterium]|nr:peptidoglycan DD-metalloendopeptidase family protein [Bacteroidales bacterium]
MYKYFLFVILFLVFLQSCKENEAKSNQETIDSVVVAPTINKLYEIVIDSLLVERGVVEPNKNLSDILLPYGINNKQVYDIIQKSDSVFNVRKIKAGNNYTCIRSNDSLKSLKYFIYEISTKDYFVINFVDSLSVYVGVKDVVVVEKVGSGNVESSLWNSMVAANVNPLLALELSDIYAWTIDFFGLQKGDSYKVVYDEEFVDSLSIGIKKIKYAVFNHYGKAFYAIPFMQDSVLSFYDENGQSLRKAFLKAPLRFSRISSKFSNARLHPVLRIVRPHHGVDYAAPIGTPVVSIGDGVVTKKEYNGGAGYMVKIKHNSVYTSAYLHLLKFGSGLNVGTRVQQGQVVGYVGSSGLSTGPHLDFRVYKNNSPVDPLKVESPPVNPVHDTLLPKFSILRDSIVQKLQ